MPRAALPFPRQAPDALPRWAGPPRQQLAEHPPPSPRRPVVRAPAPREFVVPVTAQSAPSSGGQPEHPPVCWRDRPLPVRPSADGQRAVQ